MYHLLKTVTFQLVILVFRGVSSRGVSSHMSSPCLFLWSVLKTVLWKAGQAGSALIPSLPTCWRWRLKTRSSKNGEEFDSALLIKLQSFMNDPWILSCQGIDFRWSTTSTTIIRATFSEVYVIHLNQGSLMNCWRCQHPEASFNSNSPHRFNGPQITCWASSM